MVIGPFDDRTYCARSAFTHLGLCRKLFDYSLHHSTTSQCIVNVVLLKFSSTSNRLAEIRKGPFDQPAWEVRGDVWSHGWAHLIAGPWVPISSRLTHMAYLLPFLGKTRNGVLPYCHRVRRPTSLLSFVTK